MDKCKLEPGAEEVLVADAADSAVCEVREEEEEERVEHVEGFEAEEDKVVLLLAKRIGRASA